MCRSLFRHRLSVTLSSELGGFSPVLARALVAVLVLLLFAFAHGGEETAPATPRQKEILDELARFSPENHRADGIWMLGEWDSDAGIEPLIPPPEMPGDAAACFKRLESLYPVEKEALAREDEGAYTRGVEALLEAGRLDSCRFIPDHYPEFVTTESKQPDFQILRTYLKALLRRGELSERRGDMNEAERCYQSALACGKHLTDDKSSSLIYITGLIFKLRSAQAYSGFLARNGGGERVEAAKRYVETLGILMRAYMWKANVAMGEFDEFACLPAVIKIATEDREAFWRKDAVVRLAALRYGIPAQDGKSIVRNTSFERMADEALTAVAASDSDATVRRLALWVVKNITPQNYGELEHRFQ